jgi:uncharacterized BrkB/YihY/UPF0761 family membrane protein
MNVAERAVRAVDQAQQRHPWLGYPVAVGKKFGDDQAGNLAALVAYFAFASLFPMLLVLVTVLDLVLRGDPALLAKVRSSAFAQFPVIGPEYLSKINAMHATGPALAIGLVLTFLGSRGVANAMQNALNSVWGVPLERRPGFPWNLLRSIGQVLVIGLGLIITTTLSGIASGASLLPGPASTAAAIVVSYGLNIGVFWAAFRLGTAGEITGRARPAGLAVPAGAVHPVRGGGQRGAAPRPVAAQPGSAAAHRAGPPGARHVRAGPAAPPGGEGRRPARRARLRRPRRRPGRARRQPGRPRARQPARGPVRPWPARR